MKNCEFSLTLEQALPLLPSRLQVKVRYSVDLLRKAERLAMAYDPDDGYFLAFSGGKDSQCLYHVARLAEVKFRAHMNLTSVDPPEVIRFVRREYPDVETIKPRDSIFNIAIEKRILPTMRVRWCCEEYKEKAGAGKVTLIGIRHSESHRRAQRNEVEINHGKFSGTLDGLEAYREQKNKKHKSANGKEVNITNARGERTLGCIHGKESLLISPIITWTDADVWTFLNALHIPHCELYDQGFHRIGCIGCPMSSPARKIMENKRWPHIKRNWIKAIRSGYSKERICGGMFHSPTYLGSSPPTDTARHSKRSICPTTFGKRRNTGIWCSAGFSDGSLSDRLTEEQENEIAEAIYDWWISGKSYKQWRAENRQWLRLDFQERKDYVL